MSRLYPKLSDGDLNSLCSAMGALFNSSACSDAPALKESIAADGLEKDFDTETMQDLVNEWAFVEDDPVVKEAEVEEAMAEFEETIVSNAAAADIGADAATNGTDDATNAHSDNGAVSSENESNEGESI